jgi:Zn-dependent protease
VPPDASFVVRVAVHDLLWVNFGWGFLNLLPILPLDGGNVVRSVLHAVRRRPDERLALLISITCAGLACLAAFNYGLVWAAMIAALITFNNYQALSRLGWTRSTS